MSNIVDKLIQKFSKFKILSILESDRNYLVTVCDKKELTTEAIGTIFSVDKKNNNTKEFSYFNNPDEYVEACKHVLYKYDDKPTNFVVKRKK